MRMGETETRQRLLRSVKKEVKQIMEEAVTRKFVHEDSSHIISFCAVVEACILHGLRRALRAAGFLRSNKLAALFVKVGKVFTPAEELCRKVQELEQIIESKQNQARLNQESNQKMSKLPNLSPQAIKHLWIRTALTEKVLDKIVHYLVENSGKFYEREALLRDPVDGPILASLLVGPCALEYTKAKTANHFWTDPSADELMQRHRIHSGHCRQDSPTKRPALITKRQSSGSMDERPTFWARDYVESLHQNSRATLLYGKNNVLVQPTDDMEAIPGYLSLHQTADLMTLKWTPNQLMNGNMGDLDYEKSVYWDYAMTIRLEEIVYLHCHQQVDSGGTVVLVSQDGIQRPPLRFPRGGHLLQFLTCLENGLLPHGQLDPPLWSQRGKGKVFPKIRRRSPHGSCESVSDREEDEATDYVFRILLPSTQADFVAPELIDPAMSLWQPSPRKSSCSSCSQNGSSDGGLPDGCNHDRAPLKLLCETMKYQIISRAFYGWLAYCRHLSTVRTHLSALVNPTIIEHDFPSNARGGLSLDVWSAFLQDPSVYEELELLRLVYYGGVEPSIRKEVWPFLLGHYTFTMTPDDRKKVDEQVRASYEQTMSEWLGCEAIVRQREKEQHAAALARCSSETSTEQPQLQRGPPRHDSTISSDVFGSVDEEDQPELEAKPEDQKPMPKLSNGALANGTSSPDSGHPSSRNFSTTSGLSDYSPSTDEASAHDSGARAGALSQVPVKKSEPTAEALTTTTADSPPKESLPESDIEKSTSALEQDTKAMVEEEDAKKAEVVSDEASECASEKEEFDILQTERAGPSGSEEEFTAPAPASALESGFGEATEAGSHEGEVQPSDSSPKYSDTHQEDIKIPENVNSEERAKTESQETKAELEVPESHSTKFDVENVNTNRAQDSTSDKNQDTESIKVKTPEKVDEKLIDLEEKPEVTDSTEGTIQTSESWYENLEEISSDKAPEVPKDSNESPRTEYSPSHSKLNDPEEDPGKEEPKIVEPQISKSSIPTELIMPELKLAVGVLLSDEIRSPEAAENTGLAVLESTEPESSSTEDFISLEMDEITPVPDTELKEADSPLANEFYSPETFQSEDFHLETEVKEAEPSTSTEVTPFTTSENAVHPQSLSTEMNLPLAEEGLSSVATEITVQEGCESKQEISPTEDVLSSKAEKRMTPEESVEKRILQESSETEEKAALQESSETGENITIQESLETVDNTIIQDSESVEKITDSLKTEVKATLPDSLRTTLQESSETEEKTIPQHSLETGEKITLQESPEIGQKTLSDLSETEKDKIQDSSEPIDNIIVKDTPVTAEETKLISSELEAKTSPTKEMRSVSESEDTKVSQQGLGWCLERRDSNTESEGCVSAPPLLNQHSSTLDMADSDDSPSALEMEDIPKNLICMSAEDHCWKQPLILDAPSLQRTPREPGADMPTLELHLEVGPNTSPEATESILSEEDPDVDCLFPKADSLAVKGDMKTELASPVSSIGTTYSQELLDMYLLNLHRIEKDVHRCDRNYWYFTAANLEKLRNIMCSYVWQHLEIGYVQGMCDLLAPLLVILDDEALAFSCFSELMKRMNQNFPHGGAMDSHFANMRSLIQILDSELFELMQQNGDYTHFYFCYRWFLLDFKREMVYDDVFSAWETIWAARSISSSHFVLFIALALVEHYRDIILENNMDFTEIIKFFNEMAERHDVPQVLVKARELVHKVQTLIENK
ncbi:small G protein signaling modulator 1 isoform X2 [Engraulis encrasicolus]|uniref:small G protein signaling modulator 1 isoform X2 n=1 Tax=Engraulis encrasicolus TaxID=184585 RepID=UPI002FD106B9